MGWALVDTITVPDGTGTGSGDLNGAAFPAPPGRWFVGVQYVNGAETNVSELELELSETEAFTVAFEVEHADADKRLDILNSNLTATRNLVKPYLAVESAEQIAFECPAGLWARWVLGYNGIVSGDGGTVAIFIGVAGSTGILRGRT